MYMNSPYLYNQKGVSLIFIGCGRKNFPGDYRNLPLVNSIATLQAPHPFQLPSFWPHPFRPSFPWPHPFCPPKYATLATPMTVEWWYNYKPQRAAAFGIREAMGIKKHMPPLLCRYILVEERLQVHTLVALNI